jgi:hypothetical protein
VAPSAQQRIMAQQMAMMKPHSPFSDLNGLSMPDLKRFDEILSPKLPLDSKPPGLLMP